MRPIPTIIMCLVWLLFATVTPLQTYYCMRPGEQLDNTPKPFAPFVVGLAVFSILICGGFRFWISRMRNPWWSLIPYLLGVICTWMTAMEGVYVAPRSYLLFQLIAVVFFWLYLPFFVKMRTRPATPPPLKGPSDAARQV